MKSQTIKSVSILFPALFTIFFSTAEAARYTFSIEGFNGSADINANGENRSVPLNNGKIVGSFEGVDTMDASGNPGADGLLNGRGGEISQVSLAFSGNSLFDDLGTTTFSPQDVIIGSEDMVYDINANTMSMSFNNIIGIGLDYARALSGKNITSLIPNLKGGNFLSLNSDGSLGNSVRLESLGFYTDPNAPTQVGVGMQISLNSTEQLIVSQVPLPGALLLFVSGLGGLGIFRRLFRKTV